MGKFLLGSPLPYQTFMVASHPSIELRYKNNNIKYNIWNDVTEHINIIRCHRIIFRDIAN